MARFRIRTWDEVNDSTFYGQLTVSRYLSRHVFLFPSAEVVRQITTDGNETLIRAYRGGAGWAFYRKREEQLFLRSGDYEANWVGTRVPQTPSPLSDYQHFRGSTQVGVMAPASKVRLPRAVSWSARLDYLKPLTSLGYRKVSINTSIVIPLSKIFTADLHLYNVPDFTRPGAFSFSKLTVSTSLGLSFQ